MFLRELDPNEQIAFMSLARHLVAADAKLQAQEQRMLQVLAAEMGIPVDAAEAMDYMEAVAEFESSRSRRIVLIELIGLGYVDDHFHPGEVRFLTDLFTAFGVPIAQMAEYEEWVKRLLGLIQEGYGLVAL